MASVGDLLKLGAELPGDSGRRDVEVLLCHCLGQSRSWLYTWPDQEVAAVAEAQFRDLFAARASGKPIAHLTGCRDFWSLTLSVTPDTLIPRPETEVLVEWALELALPESAAVADLGTGSGAIALAVASERPAWNLLGLDSSEAALEVARNNAKRLNLHRVQWRQSSWFEAVAGESFDLLLSNPPYIAAADPHLTQGDLPFEPITALASGADGLDDIRSLIAAAPRHLNPGGWLLLEHGFDQAEAVRALLVAAGFQRVATRRDLAALERVTGACYV